MIILKFKDASFKCIDHMGILILVISLMLPPIRHMHMPMQKIFWTVFFNQCPEHLKPLMRQVTPVIKLISGRMCHQNIKAAFFE